MSAPTQISDWVSENVKV